MLLGLCGKARAGKDYVARYLSHEFDFMRLTFASPLKDLVKNLFRMSPEQLEDGVLKNTMDHRYGITPRELLQYLGTDVLRKMYPNIWTDYGMRQYDEWNRNLTMKKYTKGVVFSDVRFVNELDAIRAHGGYVIKIVRLNEDGSLYIDTPGATKNHASETSLDDLSDASFDAIIMAGSGQLQLLKEQAKDIVEGFYASDE